MAASTLTRPSAELHDPLTVRLHYQVLREQMNRAAAIANALGLHQEADTHAYHLAQQHQGRRRQVQTVATTATGLTCFIFRFLRRSPSALSVRGRKVLTGCASFSR